MPRVGKVWVPRKLRSWGFCWLDSERFFFPPFFHSSLWPLGGDDVKGGKNGLLIYSLIFAKDCFAIGFCTGP